MTSNFPRSLLKFLAAAFCLILVALVPTAGESNNDQSDFVQRVDRETELEIGHDDEFWAELTKDEAPLAITAEMTKATAPNHVGGSWGPVIDWPLNPASIANLPDGRLLTFSGSERYSWPSTEQTYAAIWNPTTGALEEVFNDNHNMFCAAMVSTADGQIMVNGGRNTVSSASLFNWEGESWTRSDEMNSKRWYPTSIALPNGDVFTAVGKNNRYPEVWTEGAGWDLLTGADLQAAILDYGSNRDGAGWLPLMHLDPRGNILHYGATDQMHEITLAGNGSIRNLGSNNLSWYPEEAVAVQYDENHILIAGGADAIDDGLTATNKAAILDMSGPNPIVTEIVGMNFDRQLANEVVMPTGDILVIGGNTTGKKFSDPGSVLTPELWNPQTQTWTNLNNMSVPRNYHSTAILLPDGRVFAGGGGYASSNPNHPANHPDAQIFSPPYLFNSNGTLATRPQITSAPELTAPGHNFIVKTNQTPDRFTMVRLSAVTHSTNTSQRFLEVDFVPKSGGYELSMNSNENTLVPGYWMLFAFNSQGVPSVSHTIHVSNQDLLVDQPADFESNIDTAAVVEMNAVGKTGDTLSYSAIGLPPGVTINTSTGRMAGTPTDWGYYDVNVTVSSNRGATETVEFTWEVIHPDTVTTVYNFESNHGWTVNPSGSDTASAGQWKRGNPAGTSEQGNPIQLDETTSGNNALITGLNGGSVGANDVDGGLTSIRSPNIQIPVATESILSFEYNFAHLADATSADFLRISVVGDTTSVVLKERGAPTLRTGEWTTFRKDLSDFGDQTVTILIEANDSSSASVIEAAIDDVELKITPITKSPILTNPGDQDSIVGNTVNLQINATDPDGDPITFAGSNLPDGLSLNTSNGLISGIPSEPGDFNVNLLVTDDKGARDQASFSWTVEQRPLVLSQIISQPKEQGTLISYTGLATGGGGTILYKWNFGDTTPDSEFRSTPAIFHQYDQPGRYIVTLTVKDGSGQEGEIRFNQAIYPPRTEKRPNRSSSIVLEEREGHNRIWVVNPDNNSVSAFNNQNNEKLAEIPVGQEPHALAVAPDGRIWVTNQESASISIVDPNSFTVVDTKYLAGGSKPFGIVFSPTEDHAYVAQEALGTILKLNPTNGNQQSSVFAGQHVRHLAINSDGTKLYATRFITPKLPGEETQNVQTENVGGEVIVINTGSMGVADTIILQVNDGEDFEAGARGVPNYLGAPAIAPDGKTAWIPSKQDNVLRGQLRDGEDPNFEHTVRAISSEIQLESNSEISNNRIDHDNSSLASAAVYGLYGNYMFVALETSREVAVIDVSQKAEIFRIDTGIAPQGLEISAHGLTLFVHNFLDRTVGVYDMSPLINEGILEIVQTATYRPVTDEKLAPEILTGKQLFYDARDTRLAQDAYMSCASCHNDGGHDGRVWDFTGTGEGLRNTISLNGHGGPEHGRLHWSGNFDEVHDFEAQIRSFAGGTGLMSDEDFNATADPFGEQKTGKSSDLDALAAYVNSLTTVGPSPFKASNGELTDAAKAGRIVFKNHSCTSCHSGDVFTDSATNALHDIGTLKSSSGDRLGQSLDGLDTPTLIGVWETAPYLHDGSAGTLAEAVQAHAGVDLSTTEMDQLVAFLQQIDDLTPAVPPNVPPTLENPGNRTDMENDSITLSLIATDPDDPSLIFTSTGLPGGLNLNPDSGEISGVLIKDGEYPVTITVTDGAKATSTINFTWIVEPEPQPIIFSAGVHTISTDQLITVPLKIALDDTHQSLNTFSLDLAYDDSAVEVGQCTVDAGLSVSCDFGQAGTVSINGSFESAQTTNVSPATIQFKAIGDDGANSILQWTVNSLSGNAGQPVTLFEAQNGLIRIQNANTAPELQDPGDQTAKVDNPVLVQLQASDADGDSLSFSGQNLPDGLVINNDGLISGTPVKAGTFESVLIVDDGRGEQDQVAVVWEVAESTAEPSDTDYTLTVNQSDSFTNSPLLSVVISPTVDGEVQFSNSNTLSFEGWKPFSNPFEWSLAPETAPGSLNIIYAWIKLDDGLILGPIKDGIIYDPIRPTGSFTIELNPEGELLEGDIVLLHLDSSDEGSGVATMRISNHADMSESSGWIGSKSIHYWKMTGDLVYVQFQDRAGNLSPIYQNDAENSGGNSGSTLIFLPSVLNNHTNGMMKANIENLGQENTGAKSGENNGWSAWQALKSRVFGTDDNQ